MMTDTDMTLAVHEQVFVEFDLDGRPVGIRAIVVNVLPSAVWLGLARPDSLLELVQPEQPINLTFNRDGVALVATSRFLNHLGSNRSRLFSIRWPDEIQAVQRRAQLRMEAACPVEYVVVEPSDGGVAGRTGSGLTRNVSAGGALFETEVDPEEAVQVGDQLELTLGLGKDGIVTDAAVVRVAENGRATGRKRALPPGARAMLVAVRFESISTAAQDMIVRHLFSLQRQRRDRRA